MMSFRLLAVALLSIFIALGGYAVNIFGKASESDGLPDSEFALVGASLGDLDGQPALALSFSQPLDAKASYDKYIRVFKMPTNPSKPNNSNASNSDNPNASPEEPAKVSASDELTNLEGGTTVKGAWVVGTNPRMLYFPHVDPLTRYVVQTMDTLVAKSGQTLRKEVRYSIFTDDVPAASYFASRGMVLPANESGGLPVVTVNVPEIDVQFLRVREDQMPRFLELVLAKNNAPQSSDGEYDECEEYRCGGYGDDGNPLRYEKLQGAVSGWALDYLKGMADSIYQGRFLTEKIPNKRSVTYLPVESIKELKEPGIYIAVMSQPGRFQNYQYQTTYYYVSDLGLHLRQFEKTAEAFVSSLNGGSGVSGVDITWLDREGKVLDRGQTDSEGHASFKTKPSNAAIVVARKGKQMSMISVRETALDLSEFDVTGDSYRPVRVFAWSGRDLYRPGETFVLSATIRDDDGKPVLPQPLQATLRRADGKTQFISMWQPVTTRPGYYQQQISLPADAPTGLWTLELRNDPAGKQANAVMRFHVEEFLPERMKLDLEPSLGPIKISEALRVKVTGKYLYGSPAAGNRLTGVAEVSRNVNPLSGRYPGFVFGDVDDDKLQKRWVLEDRELDSAGKANIEIATDLSSAVKSPVSVHATFSLLETGGRPVIRSVDRTLWPAPVLVAVRPLYTGRYAPSNSPVEFEVIRVDESGSSKAEKGLQSRLFLEKHNYYWRYDDQRGWHSGYTETDELVWGGTLDIPGAGRARLRVPVEYGQYRLEILDPDTQMTLRYRFNAGWYNNAQEDRRPDRVTLKFDRDAYRTGDTAKLTLVSPHEGTALVTVEGDRVLWTKRVKIKGSTGEVSIPIDESWKRHDLYVSVMVLRPGDKGDNITPTRALGIIYLPIGREERKIDVVIDAPERIRPDTTVKVKVKASAVKSRDALLTLSAVDVGILNITDFQKPDPFAFFFGKLRYGADMYDIYGRLIEKMAGKKGRLKWGGDGVLPMPRDTSTPQKVKLVDLFSGAVAFNENGEAEVPLAIPDFNGTLRLNAVVIEADRFGSQSKEMVVAAPVIAEISMPRFLSFNDHSTLALDVQNLTERKGTFKVALKAASGLTVDNPAREVVLAPQQKTTLRYNVEAGEQNGLHTIDLTVQGADVQIKRQFALEVKALSPAKQQTLRYTVEPKTSIVIRDPALAGYIPSTLTAHLYVTNKPPVDVRSAVQWLLQYPYGCVEQTTSSAYPWLFVDEEVSKRYKLNVYTREQRAERISFAVGKLAGYQGPDGSFSLWGGAGHDLWLSSYVAEFLHDARTQGFSVPDAFYDKTMNHLLRSLQEGSGQILPLPKKAPTLDEMRKLMDDALRSRHNFAALAQASYVLARERKAPLSALRLLFDRRDLAESGLPLIRLGIALNTMGDNTRGSQAIEEGINLERRPGYWWWDYGSDLRDIAMSYVLLTRDKVQPPKMTRLLDRLQSIMSVREMSYFSTQERLSLLRLGQAIDAEPNKPWRISIESYRGNRTLDSEASPFSETTSKEFAEGITLSNPGEHPLFVDLALNGYTTRLPDPPAKNEPHITLEREYLRADGSPLGKEIPLVGDVILVHLRARAVNTSMGSALIVDRVPAGLEIENTNLIKGESGVGVTVGEVHVYEAMLDSRIQHVEFRDDRFVAATKLEYWKPIDLFYRARVVTPGKYLIPPLYAEDMYRPYVFGILGSDNKLTIKDSHGE
jgi:uncharacterized protein YfaS (alpha-2-macroglobulin family)